MMRKLIAALFCICMCCTTVAQRVVAHQPHAFPKTVAPGGYSGITWLGSDLYAVVSDNEKHEGYHRFRIVFTDDGDIESVENLGFVQGGSAGRDSEGVALFSPDSTLFVSGEADNQIREMTIDGTLTGRRLPLPDEFASATRAYGIEALAYNAATHRFWTTSESTLPCDGKEASPQHRVKNRLRLLAFDDLLKVCGQYAYDMDIPSTMLPAQIYALGVSALTALDDGRLLVLEREAFVPQVKIGGFVRCCVYCVNPANGTPVKKKSLKRAKPLKKSLLAEWTTHVGLLTCSFANYEGMCLGPRLADGGQVVILLADSQNQYAGILQDWFRTLVLYD